MGKCTRNELALRQAPACDPRGLLQTTRRAAASRPRSAGSLEQGKPSSQGDTPWVCRLQLWPGRRDEMEATFEARSRRDSTGRKGVVKRQGRNYRLTAAEVDP